MELHKEDRNARCLRCIWHEDTDVGSIHVPKCLQMLTTLNILQLLWGQGQLKLKSPAVHHCHHVCSYSCFLGSLDCLLVPLPHHNQEPLN